MAPVSLQQRDGFEIEFEIGTDDKGKPFADMVTSADGTPIPPPDPSRKKKKKPKADASAAEGAEDGAGESTQEGNKEKKRNRKKNEKKVTWYSELDKSVQESMEKKGIKIEFGRVFITVGEARLKVGTDGYITLANASGLVAEGNYTSSTDGKLAVIWEKALKLDGDEWKSSPVDGENGALAKEIDLTAGT